MPLLSEIPRDDDDKHIDDDWIAPAKIRTHITSTDHNKQTNKRTNE